MPRGDGTGPAGMGPMTGRAAGYCAGNNAPGFANTWFGRALGFGGGRGRRNMFFATGLPGWRRFGGYDAPGAYPNPYETLDPEVQKEGLKRQASALQASLDYVKKRLTDLESGSK